jgi:L-fuconolactonase
MEETRWATELAGRDAGMAGIVASLPLELGGGIVPDLDDLCANPLVRGVRRLFENHPDPDFCLRPGFKTGLDLLTERGLPFDICVRAHQLESVVTMVSRAPDQAFVLDHMGKPKIGDGDSSSWRAHIAALAEHGNVACKVSGLVTETNPDLPLRDQLAPYVEHVLDCFGYDRVLFGSDWHIVELVCSWRAWRDLVAGLVADASPDDRRRLFQDNARRIYRIAA